MSTAKLATPALLNCRQHPPSKASISSASKQIPQIIWNRKVHYRLHNSPPRVTILSQINPVQALPSCFFNTHFNINLPSTPWPSKWSLALNFPTKILHVFIFSAYVPYAHLTLHYFIIRLIFGKEDKSRSSS
jgi:hypothetical protein